MTQLQLLMKLSEVAVNLIFWSGIVLPIILAPFWPWWKSSWGWNIVALEFALSLALVGAILRLDLGLRTNDLLLFAWLTVFSLWTVPVIVAWRTVIILREQYRQAKREIRLRSIPSPEVAENGIREAE